MFLARGRRDGGASTAEYAGLIVLAALVLGVLVPVVATPLRDQLRVTLCKFLNPGGEGMCAALVMPSEESRSPRVPRLLCQILTALVKIGPDLIKRLFPLYASWPNADSLNSTSASGYITR